MHAANPDRSKRLSRALDYIRSCGAHGCTTAELQGYTGSMAPATDVSELRRSGYLIDCECDGINIKGRRVYTYRYRGRRMEP